MTEPDARHTPDGALTDDATDAARAAYQAGHRVDHDAGLRQARTAMVAGRAGKRWRWGPEHYGWTARDDRYELADWHALRELADMTRLDPDRLEDIARGTSRTYDEVVARWRHWHPEAGA